MANKTRKPMDEETLTKHYQDQAKERQRRGLVDFTRDARYERVMGQTPGESRVGRTTRKRQAGK